MIPRDKLFHIALGVLIVNGGIRAGIKLGWNIQPLLPLIRPPGYGTGYRF